MRGPDEKSGCRLRAAISQTIPAQAMGIAVFAGMIGVTLFGLFLTPVFYVTLMKLGWKRKHAPAAESNPSKLVENVA